MRILVLCLALAAAACASPAYDAASTVTPTCPGYKQVNQCQPWAISFRQGMKLRGYPVTLVYFNIAHRGKTIRHVAAAWLDKDGWWMRDNFSGPVQVDSFNRYSWATRVENFLTTMPEGGSMPTPTGLKIDNVNAEIAP